MTLALHPERKENIIQGEVLASADPTMTMSTVLGSCVAICLYDPVARIGGMNHFLLSKPQNPSAKDGCDTDYGLYLMELLINEMLKLGAIKSRMKARAYGGANMNVDLGPIGRTNAAFARAFLHDEGIPLVFEDLEGEIARRVDFRPATGQTRVRRIAAMAAPPPTTQIPQPRHKGGLGNVELF